MRNHSHDLLVQDMMDAGPIGEGHIGSILCETLKGLDYLHAQSKIHRQALTPS